MPRNRRLRPVHGRALRDLDPAGVGSGTHVHAAALQNPEIEPTCLRRTGQYDPISGCRDKE
ncbi:hypothetical protein GCM10009776_30840 [Microbacterium deminutum]|uniref:Uncharacterized protein n=1 Tax=Microbacterium deminutum TaxID=344164 RepID=A0ABN2RA31_9MICO